MRRKQWATFGFFGFFFPNFKRIFASCSLAPSKEQEETLILSLSLSLSLSHDVADLGFFFFCFCFQRKFMGLKFKVCFAGDSLVVGFMGFLGLVALLEFVEDLWFDDFVWNLWKHKG